MTTDGFRFVQGPLAGRQFVEAIINKSLCNCSILLGTRRHLVFATVSTFLYASFGDKMESGMKLF